MGTLYVVATPIGNLEDVSARALGTLRRVSLIAAEDTRHTGKLLAHFGIATPTTSYHAFNARARQGRLLEALATGDVALVSDAGTPALSDPGMELVDAALEAGYEVRAIPGPSSLTAAISVTGLVDGPFVFLGFAPRKGGERGRFLERAVATGYALVLFESPNRVPATLGELAGRCVGRRFAVVRELSKLHEEVVRGRFGDDGALDRYAETRGEVVLVVEGGAPDGDELDIDAELQRLIESGARPSDAAKQVAALTGQSRSTVYDRALELSGKRRGGGQPV